MQGAVIHGRDSGVYLPEAWEGALPSTPRKANEHFYPPEQETSPGKRQAWPRQRPQESLRCRARWGGMLTGRAAGARPSILLPRLWLCSPSKPIFH